MLVFTRYLTLPAAISTFLEDFPQGFYGDKYLEQERNYKVEAHQLALELMHQDVFAKLLDARDFAEGCKRALRVANATNLIFPNEKMSLRDGLRDAPAQRRFSETLYDLLFGSDDYELTFTPFCAALEELGAATWPTATYFPFIMFPERHIFLKPTITQVAAALSAFEIN